PVDGNISLHTSAAQSEEADPGGDQHEQGNYHRQYQSGWHDRPGVLGENQSIDETEDPACQQHQEIDECQAMAAITAEQADQRAEEGEAGEDQRTSQQPGGEIAPLDVIAVVVGDIAEQRAEKQRQTSRQQNGVQRMQRTVIGTDGG